MGRVQYLTHAVQNLVDTPVGELVRTRLCEFSSFKHQPAEEWFSELCFCILAANAKGRIAADIQQELGITGLANAPPDEILTCIRRHRHRFHNNKTRFIIEARTYRDIKRRIRHLVRMNGITAAREFLVKNILGFGYKEASHFLRNTGHVDVAILDRHILNTLNEHGIIRKPTTLTKKRYLRIEKKFIHLSRHLGMAPGELDLYLWYLKTGVVLK